MATASNRIVAVLPTSAFRINSGSIKPVLDSISAQSVRPTELMVVLTDHSAPSQVSTDIFEPGTRILAQKAPDVAAAIGTVLRRELEAGFGESSVIMLDDESVYPKHAFDTLVQWSKKVPNAIVARSGWRLDRDSATSKVRDDVAKAKQIHASEVSSRSGLKSVDIPHSSAGYIVKPNFFKDGKLWGPKAAKVKDEADENMWVGAIAAKKNIRVYVAPESGYYVGQPAELAAGTATLPFSLDPMSLLPRNSFIRQYQNNWLMPVDNISEEDAAAVPNIGEKKRPWLPIVLTILTCIALATLSVIWKKYLGRRLDKHFNSPSAE